MKKENEKLINAVDKYLKVNYCELYNENKLDVVFEKARKDEEVKLKMVKAISRFILI